MPPAVNVTTGRRPFSATQRTSSTGAWTFFASLYSSSGSIAPKPLDRAEDRPHVGDGVDDVAGAGLTLRPDHRGAFADAP